MSAVRFGRFAEASLWILAILVEAPRTTRALLAEIRGRSGPIGPGTLFGAIVRLEAAGLIERRLEADGTVTYVLRVGPPDPLTAPPSDVVS
jgi:DNA-binding PadR family transcriptional regulator